jgi:hypothetical protein
MDWPYILGTIGIAVILYLFGSLRVLWQYERVVVFFLGKFEGVRGPGGIRRNTGRCMIRSNWMRTCRVPDGWIAVEAADWRKSATVTAKPRERFSHSTVSLPALTSGVSHEAWNLVCRGGRAGPCEQASITGAEGLPEVFPWRMKR